MRVVHWAASSVVQWVDEMVVMWAVVMADEKVVN